MLRAKRFVATSAAGVVLTALLAGCAPYAPVSTVTGPPSLIPVPNFVGLDVATAAALIQNLDLQTAADFSSGNVVSQTPLPNEQVPPGTTITLSQSDSVSSAPTSTPDPSPASSPTPTP
ncbi:PASTA domain-containing protein [Microbacterium enclense]|uniref:PASTA domain-containing protein n=1 Tax=Microbacterium enclense TaxID=993073 RepID=UPI0009E95190